MDPLGDLRRMPKGQRVALLAGGGVAAAALLLYVLSRSSGQPNPCGLYCSQGTLTRLTNGQWACGFKPLGVGLCVKPGTTDPAQLRYIAPPGVCISNDASAFLEAVAPPDCTADVGSGFAYVPTKIGTGYTCCPPAGGQCFTPAPAGC